MKKSNINCLMPKYLESRDPKIREEIIFEWEKSIDSIIDKHFKDYYDREDIYYFLLINGIRIIDEYINSEKKNLTIGMILLNRTIKLTRNYIKRHDMSNVDLNKDVYYEDREMEDYIIQKVCIGDLFDTLTKKNKDILTLFTYGYSISELASIYNCSYQNIEFHINCSLERLKWAKGDMNLNECYKYHQKVRVKDNTKSCKVIEDKSDNVSIFDGLARVKCTNMYKYLLNFFDEDNALVLAYILYYNANVNYVCCALKYDVRDINEKLKIAREFLYEEKYKRRYLKK